MSFDERIHPCNQHLNQDKILCFPPVNSYPSIGNHCSDFYYYGLVSPVLESTINEIIQWVLFHQVYFTQNNFFHIHD